MSKVLRDPIKPSKKVNGEYPFEFKAPSYDNRTSCSMAGGDDYGTGFRTPIGRDKPRSIEDGPIPQQAEAFSTDKIFYGKNNEDKKG